jgi:hypothetical protein
MKSIQRPDVGGFPLEDVLNRHLKPVKMVDGWSDKAVQSSAVE